MAGKAIELVVNPAAGGGRAGRMLGDVSRELARVGFSVTVHRTVGCAEMSELTRKLVAQGAPYVGVMGGDGTFHDAINSLLGDDGAVMDASRTTFAVIPAGTGGDLAARTLGIPSSPAAVADHLARVEARPFDVGRLEYTTSEGKKAVTLFTNIASFGMSGRVDELVNTGPKWLTGKGAYLAASLRALVGWKHRLVRIFVDDKPVYDGAVLTVAVANGRAFGGGMMVAPEADCADGELDVVILGDLPLVELTQVSASIYKGTHVKSKNVHTARGKVVRVETDDPTVLLDVDGETPGRVPGVFTVLPGAIRLLR